MAILAKTQKWYEGKSERGGIATSPLLRERVKLIHGNELKFARVVENHKLINVV